MHGVRNQALAICQDSRQTKNWCNALWAFPARLYTDEYESFAAKKDYTSSLKPSSVSANCYKNTRLGELGEMWVDGGEEGEGRSGFLIIKCFVRNTDMVLTVFPCRTTNSSATKWQFRQRMLFYRGDKLQVSFVALGERFRAAFQHDEWKPEPWLTAAPDRAQSLRSAAITSSLPMKMSVRSECPTHSALSCNDDESLENMSNLPFFFLPISLFSEMMNDAVSPSRTATHTSLLPGIYRVTGSCVDHFSLILYCCLSTVFCLYLSLLQVTFNVTGNVECSLCGLYFFSCIVETVQLVKLKCDHWDTFLILWNLCWITCISKQTRLYMFNKKKNDLNIESSGVSWNSLNKDEKVCILYSLYLHTFGHSSMSCKH